MSIGDKIADVFARAFGGLVLRELRGIRIAIERGVDSQREMKGFQPLFKAQAPPATDNPAEPPPEAEEPIPTGSATDYMTLEILEMLAQENHILITPDTDLIALGKDRQWLDQSGQLITLPQQYQRLQDGLDD